MAGGADMPPGSENAVRGDSLSYHLRGMAYAPIGAAAHAPGLAAYPHADPARVAPFFKNPSLEVLVQQQEVTNRSVQLAFEAGGEHKRLVLAARENPSSIGAFTGLSPLPKEMAKFS